MIKQANHVRGESKKEVLLASTTSKCFFDRDNLTMLTNLTPQTFQFVMTEICLKRNYRDDPQDAIGYIQILMEKLIL